MRRPIVVVPACTREIGVHRYHVVQMKYVDAVLLAADCMPLVLPALGEKTDWEAVLAIADGVMLTGSPSNLHPGHYGQSVSDPSLPQDAARDATTLPLIRAVLQRDIPLLAVCRGAQEINVALGGTLHQAVQDVAGMLDHREQKDAPLDLQYGACHRVKLAHGGRIAGILGGGVDEIMVNSLHGQGIDRLAPGLESEACADDGLIEAYRVRNSSGFSLAVQWHPEWKVMENPLSMKLFAAFGQACREYQAKKEECK